jgi:acyl-lipid omega-6 desaturase (Delta-12 desaturase)
MSELAVQLVEDIVGNFFFAPLLYPFEPWRIKHNQHHAFTNKLQDDTAWHPVMKDEAADLETSTFGASASCYACLLFSGG